MRKLYEMVSKRLDQVDFGRIYPGFHRFPFALYNDENIWLEDREIPQQGFFGNTAIEFEGRQMAIWKVTGNIDETDPELLASNIVHEMFHAFQNEQNMSDRWPDDMKMMMYPSDADNYLVKQHENIMLADAIGADFEEKVELYRTVLASRKLREQKIGSFFEQEFLIEQWEGVAESCGMLALKQLSPEKFARKLEDYRNIVRRGDFLFDVRKNAYFTGTLMRLLRDEIGDTDSTISTRLETTLSERRKKIDTFMSEKRTRTEAVGFICGYDPMNQFRVGDLILAQNLICIRTDEEMVSVNGEVLVEMQPGSPNRTVGYWK